MNKYKEFNFTSNNYIITHKHTEHGRTDSGKGWAAAPVCEYTEITRPKNYNYFVQSVPFFNGFLGGTCRAKWAYTCAGYIPVTITTTSPDKKQKNIDTFTFDFFPMDAARRAAGWRENDVLDNLARYEKRNDGGHVVFTFYHNDGEHTASYSTTARAWIG